MRANPELDLFVVRVAEEVGTAYPLRADERPLLGPGDLALTVDEDGAPAIVELKAGSDHNALGPCSWDALKLAFTLGMRRAHAAPRSAHQRRGRARVLQEK